MARHDLSGDAILLFIDPLGGTAYDTVICLTDQTWTGGNTIIDASSKCGPSSLLGTANPEKVDFSGNQMFDEDAGELAIYSLTDLVQNKTLIGWKIAPAEPQEGDEIIEGTGWIGDLSKSYASGSAATFTASIAVSGRSTHYLYTGS